MRRAWSGIAAVLLLAASGCDEGPRYCGACAEIRGLQAKADRTDAEAARLRALKAEYQESAKKLAAYARIDRDLPDLHPDCDCPCHMAMR